MDSYFLLKLDANGNFVWVNDQSIALGRVQSIALDASNNIFIIGEFSSSMGYSASKGSFITVTSGNSGQSENATIWERSMVPVDQQFTVKSLRATPFRVVVKENQ